LNLNPNRSILLAMSHLSRRSLRRPPLSPRFRALLCLAAAALATAVVVPTRAADPDANATSPATAAMKLSLWAGKAPVGDGQLETLEAGRGPVITVHRPPAELATGTALVICPGGGYGGLVTGAEGHGIAKWLNSHGIAGIVLEYRLPRGRAFVPLLDAQRALRTVRFNAKSWDINPDRIGIIGFSAGGHLASTAATQFDDGKPGAEDPVERMRSRPDFAVLVYPVVTLTGPKTHGGSRDNLLGRGASAELAVRFSAEQQVTDKTPPMFLTHAVNDSVVPVENSRQLHGALKARGIATEYLELPSGNHGLDGYKGPMWDAWQTKSIAWLKAQKLVQPRAAGR
jgi:acetyl esterase/lipase